MATTLAAAERAVKQIVSAGQIGGWKLNEELGAGGFGSTWLATKKGLDGRLTKAVVKLTQPQLLVAHDSRRPTDGQQSFLSEFVILKTLRNVHIAEIFDGGIEETKAGVDVPWLALERIEGTNLAEDLAHGAMSERRWLSLARDLFEALEVVHAAGLVHLDLKPANVMLRPRGAVLIDFGIAERRDRMPSGFGGTLGFFAPEQLDGHLDAEDAAPAVDMFKAGVTLAYAALLRNPWKLDLRAPYAQQRQTLRTAPNLEGMSETQRRIVAPLLAFDPTKRPTASRMRASAERAIEGPPAVKPEVQVRMTPPDRPLNPPPSPPRVAAPLTPPQGAPRPGSAPLPAAPAPRPGGSQPAVVGVAPRPTNRDAVWSWVLLGLGFFGMLGGIITWIAYSSPSMQRVPSEDGFMRYTPGGFPAFIGISHILIYAVAVVLTLLRRRAGKVSFWIPLAAGGLAFLVFLIGVLGIGTTGRPI